MEGSVARGWEPYDYPDTNEGYEDAKANLTSPLQITEVHGANGKSFTESTVQYVTVVKAMDKEY